MIRLRTSTFLMLMGFIACLAGCNSSSPPPAPKSADNVSVSTSDMKAPATPPMQEEPNGALVPAEQVKKGEEPAVPSLTWKPDQVIDLKFSTWAKIQESLTSYKGKVVVIDLWATTCIPCRREFPHLIELQKQYPNDVIAISVSCDHLGDADKPAEFYFEKALKFLKDKNANITNYLLEDPQPKFFSSIELISLPAIYVYDQKGVLKQRFDNDKEVFGPEGFTYQKDIVPLVTSLIKPEG